jgi:hypothetical protein
MQRMGQGLRTTTSQGERVALKYRVTGQLVERYDRNGAKSDIKRLTILADYNMQISIYSVSF